MELLERFARGDLDAFEILFRQYQADVHAWILRIVRNESAAEDLTLEAFWRIYKARARFDPNRSFGAWARRIATNLALHHLRRARPEPELPENIPAPSSEDPAVRMEVIAGVQRAIRDLPAKLRIVAVLALVEERPYSEIAESLGITVGGVKTRVFRAVGKLRRRLTELGITP
jgi:RNA polymerase sigma-70 factor (ECF subfamily)